MTPESFARLRQEERRMREVIVATAACERMRGARKRQSPLQWRLARGWVVAGSASRLAKILGHSRQAVHVQLQALGIPVNRSLVLPQSRRQAGEPEWRFCEHCGALIPFRRGMPRSEYARRSHCDRCANSLHTRPPHYHRQCFTDEEMIRALRQTESVVKAAAILKVTRLAVLSRCGNLYIRQLLGIEDPEKE